MGKAQSKLSPEQLSDLQKSTKCMLLNISDMQNKHAGWNYQIQRHSKAQRNIYAETNMNPISI
jgi:hypothetical protein